MIFLDDTDLPDRTGELEIVRRVGRRVITHAFHDIDGTHSLIREWPPVMSALVAWVIAHGLPERYDREENAAYIASHIAVLRTQETDRFAVESAGLSALTQMEWAIRRALQEGTLTLEGGPLTAAEQTTNDEIIQRTWAGRERFADLPDAPRAREFAETHAPRLFQLYEAVLAKASRDANLAAARLDPVPWRVAGSLEFLQRLHEAGVRNYFVTGSVMSTAQRPEGMLEEVIALGFAVGPGQVIEAAHGSRWDRKMPKDEVMRELLGGLQISGSQVLVVGDGRSEVQAGVAMGAVVLSRLDREAHRLRELHRELGTNYLAPDYSEPALNRLLREREEKA